MDRLAATGIPAANRVFTYDTNGFLASETDWNGNKTTYVNNTRGLETSRTEAYTTGLARTITTTWHSTLAVPTQITAPRKTTTFTYDSAGNMLTRTETDTTSQSVPYSTNGQTRTWTYTYDSLGHVLTVTGPRTDVTATTTYTYDSTTGNLETVTDALNHVSTIDSYNNRGLPTQMTDPNGMVTTFTYDERGRLLTRTVDDGGADATTTFGYNAAGLVTSITLPDGYELNYEYDDAHRLTAVENDDGERIEYTLDDAGKITEQDIKNSGGGIVKTQSRTFDIIGRMLTQVGASSQTTTYGYDSQSNRTSVKDALNDTTSYAFDALNRLITITDPLTHATSYAYDAQDNRTSVTDPRSLVTSYVYDGFGRVIQETSPDRGTTVYVLDKAGNITSETDARSIVTNRTFDKLDRVLTETFPSSSGEDIDYTYDSTSGGNYGIGHMTAFTDGSGSTTLTYDKRGNVISTTRTIGSESYTTEYAYDLADHITSITYPSGTVIGYGRDDSGRIATVTLNPSGSATALASDVTYKAFGPLAALDYGNGLARTHGYDQDFRLTAIVTTGSGGDIQDLEIAYNGVDNITSITDYLDSTRDQDFTYDDLYRLTQAIGKYGTIDYTYDNNGNRATRVKSSTTQTYSYATSTNRLTSITNYSGSTTRNMTYAANGNVATDDRAGASSYAYTFGHRNRYDALSIGGSGAATYAYNARGERVSKTVSSTTTHFHYDEAGHLIAESDGSTGNVIREYVWLDDMPLAQIESGGSIYYIHPDHLNTPQKITDASKNIVWDRIAEPFGEQYSLSSSITHNLRFPGHFADSESALNYNYFRDYDSTMGRYIETDPIGLDGTTQASMGLYNYTPANPIRYIDPKGLDIFGLFDFGGTPMGLDDSGKESKPSNCPANDNNPKGTCPFLRELPEELTTPGNRTCIFRCASGQRAQEISRAFQCRTFILPHEGQPYTPINILR
ncbi:MAG: RHS repeat protein [Planctomyces sp.]|nr:RHS repeat protein [Planctomyces sp.]